MLHAFGVKNYYNLNMTAPVVLQKGVSFIYGICGSGKTNLCRALGDIIEFCPESETVLPGGVLLLAYDGGGL